MFFQQKLHFFAVHTLVVGYTPYDKRHASGTEPVLLQVSDQFDAFFNPKNSSEKNAKISLRHLLVNLKNVRVLAPPMLFSIGLWRQ